jgi:GDP-L-fucose synthase
MKKNSKIYVAGHRGLVGSAITRALQSQGFSNLILRTHAELDLLDQKAVLDFFAAEKPEYVFLAAAKVGGILANDTKPSEFIYENLVLQSNVIHEAYCSGAKKLLFLGSSCVYPAHAAQPLKEEYLLTGPLEPTNEAYAVAKIAGLEMCKFYKREYGANFISVMPTNTYGPNDNFDPETSHALPGMLGKFHKAKSENAAEVVLWGTGKPRREFIFADDLAEACVFLMDTYDGEQMVNIGVGADQTIAELAALIKNAVGFTGTIQWDSSKPDGMEQKLLDVSKLNALGFTPKTDLASGIKKTYEWYLANA